MARFLVGLLCAAAIVFPAVGAAQVAFNDSPGGLEITIHGAPFATYVYQDTADYGSDKLTRPYFKSVHAPGAIQVTRNHPLDPDKDLPDHKTFHPGIWMAFGDISGADSWRMKTAVRHEAFVEPPHGGEKGSFVVRNAYLSAEGGVVCYETCRYTIVPQTEGYFLLVDSQFTNAAKAFVFGDQEEMGLGIRAATPLSVKAGKGKTINSYGQVNEQEAWGKQADWAAITGELNGRQVCAAVMPHPDNFRRCWFHVRDSGLIIANPFGRKAYTKGEPSAVEVKPGETFSLKYGVALVAGDTAPDPAALYERYLLLSAQL